ncbi:MAG: LysR substrate-binding domain-containing protein [Parvibaculaceae bacterium]
MRRLPPLNALRAFEATARHLSMTRAAAELNVTHGAVSHQVRALEQRLNVSLFRRSGGSLQLTPYGSALLPAISQAFGSIAEAVSLLTEPGGEGDLALCCLPSLMTFWLLPRLDQFSRLHPGVRLKLIASNDRRRVHDQSIDLWITYGVESWPDRECELWFQPRLIPVASPALINARPLRSVADLRLHALLHADDGREWSRWLVEAGVPELACGANHVMSDGHLSIEAAMHGHGIALCDSLTSADLLACGKLVRPLDHTIVAPDSFYLVYQKGKRRSSTVRAFINWAFAEASGAAKPEQPPLARRRPRARAEAIAQPGK